MMNILKFTLMAVAAITIAACGAPAGNAPAGNANANANANAAKPTAAAPTTDALMAIEKTGWDAWKNRDGNAIGAITSDRYVGFAATGRQDKAASMKSISAQNCKINSYSFSDEQMNMIGADVAVLTFRAAQDYTCDGKKGPADVWASSVYIREGDKWNSLVYVENPVIDPKKPVANVAKKGEAKTEEAKPDALADTLLAIEKTGWEAWKVRDAKGVESVMGKDFMYVSGNGRRDRAASLKGWSDPKCEGLGYTLFDAKAIQLAPDVALITYRADSTGKCDGIAIPPTLWVASFDVKEGDAWKNAFYTDVNR
ncbi:MAG: nuclear transport factor 2 family protein [Pyrinomonadaceae bacterium]